MSFLPRRILLALSIVFSAVSVFAADPSARYETAMAYDAATGHAILFGGLTGTDTGTKQPYYLADTWQWNGGKWVQLFPQHAPPGRSGHVMVYDSLRKRVVLFGGHTLSGDVNDTWVFNGTDWSQVDTPNAPPVRFLSSAAYDAARDRVVIFGGTQTVIANNVLSTKAIYDTWEFDGTTWRQIGGDGPQVAKPLLVDDAARNKVLMLGIDSKSNTLMYGYDAAAGTWNQLTPATLPTCVNEGLLVYDESAQTPVFTSGICTTSNTDNETFDWDGTNWTKLDAALNAPRVFGAAAAYDINRNIIVEFGGTPPGSVPWNSTYVFTRDAGWLPVSDSSVPGGRSLFPFVSDPAHNTIWLFGGIDSNTTNSDLWQFQNGIWQRVTAADNAPAGCGSTTAALDTDRDKLVVVCGDSATFEWDGSAWKSFTLKTFPPARSFSSMTYDPTLKKTVLFGGFDGNNYLDQTWTWDGSQWQRVKSNPAPSRELAAMWWDPNLKKTVIYGGLGRITSNDRLTRFDDMWTFDGNGWTQLKPASGTPGPRYGAQVAVDPRTNHALLFGGLRVDTIAAVPPATIPTEVQVYADDFWEWDGTAWTKKATDGVPPPRENGGLAYDPTLDVMVLYGGWAGHFLSDMWTLTGNDDVWRVRPEFAGGRRRAVSRP